MEVLVPRAQEAQERPQQPRMQRRSNAGVMVGRTTQARMTASGSMVAARHAGTIVAAV